MEALLEKQTIVKEIITPERANNLLANNIRNRAVNQNLINSLSDEIKNKNWKFNGESIKFDRKGNLVDGQHRLFAVVKAGIPIETLVIYGLDSDVFHTIDTGKKRTAGDVLSIYGEKNAYLLAATCRWIRVWENNFKDYHLRIPHSDVLKSLEAYPEARVSTDFATNKSRIMRKAMPTSIISFTHFVFHKSDSIKAELFFHDLVKGTFNENSPILLLRELLYKNQVNDAKLKPISILALTVKTWNAFKNGKEIKVLRWQIGNKKQNLPPEKFPNIL